MSFAMAASSVPTAIRNSPEAIGLAVIITNDYSNYENMSTLPGTIKDGQGLSSAFSELQFAVCWVQNVDSSLMNKVIQDLRSLKYDSVKNYRCILFAYSGAGLEGGKLIMNDGSMISVDDVIINPLLHGEIESIQKIFLIDSCRGPKSTKNIGVDKVGGEEVASKGGFLVAYSTMSNHVSYEEVDKGGLWFFTLTNLLKKKKHLCSIDNLLTKVNEDLRTTDQQPEKWSRLNKIICLNPNCSNPDCSYAVLPGGPGKSNPPVDLKSRMILVGVKKDKKGENYCLKGVISGKWRGIGEAIGLDYIELDEIRDDKTKFQDNAQRLTRVVQRWEEDTKLQEHYAFTVEDLCTLLRDCDHGVAANKFEGLLANL